MSVSRRVGYLALLVALPLSVAVEKIITHYWMPTLSLVAVALVGAAVGWVIGSIAGLLFAISLR